MEDTQNYEASQKNRVGTSTKHGKKGIATRFQWIFLVLIISTVVISTTAIVLALLPSKEVLESNAPESQTSLLDLEELEYFKVETQRLIMSLSHQLNNSQVESEILGMELAYQKASINSFLTNASESQTPLLESFNNNEAEMERLIMTLGNQLNNSQIESKVLEMELVNQKAVINGLLTNVASLSAVQRTLENRVDTLHPNMSKY